jgi:flagellar L-ring protein FlgH
MKSGFSAALAALAMVGSVARAQSLNLPPTNPAPGPASAPSTSGQPARAMFGDSIYDFSLISVRPPQPKSHQIHDLVTIIIEETSSQQAQQKLETNKKYNLNDAISRFPSLRNLLELQLVNGDDSSPFSAALSGDHKFSGDGKFERKDRFTARITARVIDVKPNGVLVLEARKHVAKNEEVQGILISGECRQEDVTDKNTVLSSQIADLTLLAESSGEVDKAATKGLIPRLLETLFAF